MKRLHEKVNIIPLIAKADTMTPEECKQFKKQVRGSLLPSLPHFLLTLSGSQQSSLSMLTHLVQTYVIVEKAARASSMSSLLLHCFPGLVKET